MFDSSKTVTLRGTVKEFQWVNPHCFIQLVVTGEDGPVEWSIEMGSPMQIYRSGWRPTTVQVGQSVIIVMRPMRHGSRGGLFVSGTSQDGKPLGIRNIGSPQG
jgi:hypothetical protein